MIQIYAFGCDRVSSCEILFFLYTSIKQKEIHEITVFQMLDNR